MVPSVRNAEAGHLHVLKNAECTKLFHSAEFTKTASQLQSKKSELETFELASLEALLEAPPKHYPYNKHWSSSWKEPVIIAHSSGSTGIFARFGCSKQNKTDRYQDSQSRSW